MFFEVFDWNHLKSQSEVSFEEFEPFEEPRENCPLKRLNFCMEGSVYLSI